MKEVQANTSEMLRKVQADMNSQLSAAVAGECTPYTDMSLYADGVVEEVSIDSQTLVKRSYADAVLDDRHAFIRRDSPPSIDAPLPRDAPLSDEWTVHRRGPDNGHLRVKRTGLRAAPVRETTTELFVSRLDPYSTARELREHFDPLNIQVVEIEALDSKYDNYASFRIKVLINMLTI